MAEDNSWVFDSLVCFLHGPVWNAPIQTFIEEKSYIFDPNQECDPSNPIYQKLYEEYKTLVDFMLGSFMEELQITPEQFEMACLEGRHQHSDENPLNFHQGLFQQIWAANDIKMFMRMMTQRNIELQLQALDLIERKQNSETKTDAELSKENIDESVAKKILEDESIDHKTISKIVEKELLNPSKEEFRTNDTIPQEEKFERLNLFFKNKEINPDDLQARQDYLRSQRDKILEIKKKARAKQLNESVRKIGRPTSAQAAQKVLQSSSVQDVIQSTSDEVTNSASELRKALAKRLREEVVEKENK